MWNRHLFFIVVVSGAFLLNAWGFAQVSSSGPPICSDGLPCVAVSALPAPSDTLPLGGATGGTVGTLTTYQRGDTAPKHIVQSTNVTLGTDCTWSATFASQPFTSSTPIVTADPIISAGATQPMTCNVIATSTTTQSGKCFQGQPTVLNLSIITTGLTLSAFNGTSCPASRIMVIGREPTQ